MGRHPLGDLDEAFATPTRLALMAVLGRDTEIDFATLRDLLEVSDSVLSKSISHLAARGYVIAEKGVATPRPRTWIRSTAAGRRALASHVTALRAITEGVDLSATD